MIEIIRKVVESLGYPFFFGTRDEVYAYINRVRTCVAVYRQGNANGLSQSLVFKFKGDKPQKMYYDVFAELKKVLTVGVQRTFFYDDVLEVRCPVMKKVFIGGGVRPTPPVVNDYMYFEAAEANSTVSLMSSLETAPDIEYSTDGETWQEWQHTTADDVHTFDTLTLTAVGDRVYLRGDNPNGLADMTDMKVSLFSMAGKINAGGNIMSLLDKTMALTVVPAEGFMALFGTYEEEQNPNTALLTTPAMDTITSIGEYGCFVMYFGCTSLTSAADIPLLTSIGESGCGSMYFGCTSLTSAADIPLLTSIGESGCGGMYGSCTFAMSSDGTTLNFDFPDPPVTAGETTYSTAYEIAEWMGNTNGFSIP